MLLVAQPAQLGSINGGLAALANPAFLGGLDALNLTFPPQVVRELGDTLSMSRNTLPATVPVSTGCSVVRRMTLLPFNSYLPSCRSFMGRARRSMRVTIKVLPGCTESGSACSSVLPSRLEPLAFLARTTPQPAALTATRWMARFWSRVPTRA